MGQREQVLTDNGIVDVGRPIPGDVVKPFDWRRQSDDELWRRRSSNKAARDELIRRYIPFSRGIAMSLAGGREPHDDLFQVAYLGLIGAVDRFDPDRGTRFEAFAAPTISGEIKRHFRDRVWSIRVPRALHDQIAQLDSAVEDLTVKLSRSPTPKEVAAELGMEEETVLETICARSQRVPLSLDAPRTDSEDEPTIEFAVGAEDPHFDLADHCISLRSALDHLDQRSIYLLKLRYVDELTQAEIADHIGCSQMHVSRLLRRVHERLRAIAER
jgi:RNA polymerase sigma-B factor